VEELSDVWISLQDFCFSPLAILLRGAWMGSLTYVNLMVRCGAHLLNLALGSSKMTLRLFGTKAVQEVFESEVVRPSNN
jgi:hypothetical protein